MECTIQGGTVFYKIVGEGMPLVLLHGRVADHRYMEAIFEMLFAERERWQRVYLDLPGCGQTQVDASVDSHDRELEVVLECLDCILPGRRFALAGVSHGGYLARGVVHRMAHLMNGLCLLVPRIQRDMAMTAAPEPLTLGEAPTLRAELDPDGVELLESLVVQSRERLERLRDYFVPGAKLHDQTHGRRVRETSPGFSFEVDRLELPFGKPALIVTGRQDSSVGYRDAWKILEGYPRATFAVLDRAGHFLGMVEQIELVRALLHEWLDRVEMEKARQIRDFQIGISPLYRRVRMVYYVQTRFTCRSCSSSMCERLLCLWPWRFSSRRRRLAPRRI